MVALAAEAAAGALQYLGSGMSSRRARGRGRCLPCLGLAPLPLRPAAPAQAAHLLLLLLLPLPLPLPPPRPSSARAALSVRASSQGVRAPGPRVGRRAKGAAQGLESSLQGLVGGREAALA